MFAVSRREPPVTLPLCCAYRRLLRAFLDMRRATMRAAERAIDLRSDTVTLPEVSENSIPGDQAALR